MGTANDCDAERAALRQRIAALESDARRFETILAGIPDIVMEVDARKIYTWANQPGLEFFGSDVIGREAASYFEGEQDTYDRVRPLFGGDDRTCYVESWQRRRDGERRLLAWWCRVLKDETGSAIGALSTARDVTDERRAQTSLRESERKFHATVKYLDDGFYSCAMDGVLHEHNVAFNRILGFDPDADLRGYRLPDFWQNPDDRQEYLDELLSSGVARDFVINAKTIDGRKIVVMANSHLARDEQGRPLRIDGTFMDFTEHKRAEQALRASEQRYRMLVENLDDMVFSVDTEARFSYVSSAVTRYGYTPEEMTGRSIRDFIHAEDLPGVMASLERTLAGQLEPYEFRALAQDGTIHFVRSASRPIETDGQISGVTGVLIDLTAQRETEQQLRTVQKMEAIGSLAGGVAHDFNNLLSVILTNTSFALDALPAADPLREDLQEIQTAGQRAASLTRQLLAFSRKQLMRPEVLDCNAVIADVEKMLRRLIGEDVALVVRPAAGLWPTKADRGQLEQVIMNLAVNARDAMPGGGRLTIETANVEVDAAFAERHPGSRPGPHVRLTVADTGWGMDQTTLARMFEPFFTTKAAGKGTGLGLATVYGIVKQSGGGIWVDSVVGQGTTFTIHLPRTADEVEDSPRPAAVKQATSGNETVLIVEDEEAVRNVARRILSAAGYQLLVAADGAAALELCARLPQPVGLVLTDVVMPGMSGRALVERLARQTPQIKALYMSGYTDDAIAHQGVLDPGTHFIAKPFTREELVRCVRNALRGDVDGAPGPGATRAETPDRGQTEVAGQKPWELPAPLLDSLRAAAIAARFDELHGLVQQVAGACPALAGDLGRRADAYDYDGILRLLEGGRP